MRRDSFQHFIVIHNKAKGQGRQVVTINAVCYRKNYTKEKVPFLKNECSLKGFMNLEFTNGVI